MDILFQYLNIRKHKQEYIKVVDAPCSTVYQALGLEMADRAVSFIDYMQQTYQSTYLFVGIMMSLLSILMVVIVLLFGLEFILIFLILVFYS